MNSYIGRDEQIFGIEEHRLIGGKGDGMRLYEVTNGMAQIFYGWISHHLRLGIGRRSLC